MTDLKTIEQSYALQRQQPRFVAWPVVPRTLSIMEGRRVPCIYAPANRKTRRRRQPLSGLLSSSQVDSRDNDTMTLCDFTSNCNQLRHCYRLDIATRHEDSPNGSCARYVLETPVEIICVVGLER